MTTAMGLVMLTSLIVALLCMFATLVGATLVGGDSR